MPTCVPTPCQTIDEAFALFNCGKMYKAIEIASDNETVSETIRKSFGNQVGILFLPWISNLIRNQRMFLINFLKMKIVSKVEFIYQVIWIETEWRPKRVSMCIKTRNF